MSTSGSADSGMRPFMAATPDGPRFELVTSDSEPPFAVLDDSGRFSRVLHGRIRLGTDHTLLEVAVKVQRDAYLISGVDGAVLTNDAVDEMWRREVADHRSIRSEHVAQPLPLQDAHESPPVLYCRHRQVYFHPPSPGSGEPLRVCRDDVLLQDSGLRRYHHSLQRYLVDQGSGAGGRRVFYKRTAVDDERPRQGVEVRVGAALFTDLAPVAHGAVAATAWFPCASCSERHRCYPRGGDGGLATERLVPLSYYDFAFLLLPALPLSHDELTEVLGGAPWREVKERALAGGGRSRRALLDALDGRLDGRRQWLTPPHDAASFALEVLRTKLGAVRDVAAGMAAVHRACERPHLGIEPRNVMATFLPVAGATPARWAARLQLLDLGAARRFLPAHPSRRDVPLRLVPDGAAAYRAPSARAVEGAPAVAHVRVEGVTPTETGNQVALRAQFAPDFKVADYRPGDLVRVMLTPDDWTWAEVVEVARAAMTLQVVDPSAAAAALLSAQREFSAHVALHKALGPACDLHGLGMLLFKTLLANDEHPAGRVEEVVGRCVEKVAAEVEDKGREPSPRTCRQILSRRMDDHGDLFRPSALFHDRAQRARDLDGFPAELWSDLLAFGFRLLTCIRGFSFADSHADADPHNPGALAAVVLAELDELLARVHTELFRRRERDAELAALCRSMLGEVRETMLGGGADETERGRLPNLG